MVDEEIFRMVCSVEHLRFVNCYLHARCLCAVARAALASHNEDRAIRVGQRVVMRLDLLSACTSIAERSYRNRMIEALRPVISASIGG